MCIILLLLRLATNMFMNSILIIAEMRLNLTNSKIEIYPVEGPMLKAPVAPFPLMVSCSKSWTTVDAGRCTQCRPSNIHRKVDEADPRKRMHHQKGDKDVPRKKRTTSNRGDAPQKIDRRTHLSRCPDVNGGFGGLLSQSSVHTEDGTLSTRVQLNSEDGLLWRVRQQGDGREGNAGEIRETMSPSDYE